MPSVAYGGWRQTACHMEYHLLPRFIQFEVTYACNAACPFCYNPSRGEKVPASHSFAIASELDNYQIRHVQLIGGEVTMLPFLGDLLKRLSSVRTRSVVTNGLRCFPELGALVNEIYVSLHGTKTAHEELTGQFGRFQRVLRSIKTYVKSGASVYADSLLTSANWQSVGETASLAMDLGMRGMFLNVFQSEGMASKQDYLRPTLDQVRYAIDKILDIRQAFGFPIEFGTSTPHCIDSRLQSHGLAFTCGVGDWMAVVSPNGDMRGCNHASKAYGNILQTPLHDIWHSEEFTKDCRSLAGLSETVCGTCESLRLCRGGCRIESTGCLRPDYLAIGMGKTRGCRTSCSTVPSKAARCASSLVR